MVDLAVAHVVVAWVARLWWILHEVGTTSMRGS